MRSPASTPVPTLRRRSRRTRAVLMAATATLNAVAVLSQVSLDCLEGSLISDGGLMMLTIVA